MVVKPGWRGLAVALFASCALALSVSVAWAVTELTQKPGAAGCISEGGSGGCRPGIGLESAIGVATSPDGNNVYVASRDSDSVSIFKRSPDGALEQLPGAAGCISRDGEGGCQPGIGLHRAGSVAVSADGKNVYVASTFSSAVAVFNRDPDGTLEQPPGAAGCIAGRNSEGCQPGIGLNFLFAISLSPDGKNAYVASAGSAAVTILNRNPDGTLGQPLGTDACVSMGDAACQPGIGLVQASGVAASPDGRNVYVASAISDAVAIFNRNDDGTLEQLPGTAGCISSEGGGCQPTGIGLDGANSVAVSADGNSVYVASALSDAVAIFSRGPNGTLEQLPGAAGCISQGGGGGCRSGIGLDGAGNVATSADGRNVYVTSFGSDAVAIFSRNPDGTLEQLPGAAGCISQGGGGGCRPGIGLDAANGVATSPDGKSVYVASLGSDEGSGAVAIFDRAVPPVPSDTSAPTVSGFRVTPKRFKTAPTGRSRFRFRLSEPSAVKIEIDRIRPGRKVGKRCRRPTPKLAKHPRCRRFIKVGKTLSFQNRSAGRNRIAFNGKVSGRALKPDLYRASITAKDTAGNSSAPRRARFSVLLPRK
jgi:DNA-binding beta-propeller fold protein YncE